MRSANLNPGGLRCAHYRTQGQDPVAKNFSARTADPKFEARDSRS